MTELPDRLLRDALEDTASATLSATCVDAVRLAAWADGTMTGTERSAVETHAAGCARCLALLAAMTRTEPRPIAPPWRRSPMAWLLPLAAVTAGLVIVVRLAVLERPAASLPAAAPAAPAPPRMSLPQGAPASALPPGTSVASKAPAPTRRPEHAPAAAEAGRAALAATDAAAKDTAASKPAATPTPAPAAPAQAPPSAQVAVTSPVGDQMAGGRGGGGGRGFAAQSAMKAAAGTPPGPILIASPDRDSLWRIVAGTVEHTADGGATWQPQPIGVATPMRAGAAPDARVCWLAGVAGVVLRTTDGTAWTRVPFPELADLVAIQATDASYAVVTTADGRRFTTSNGGATWSENKQF